MSRYKLNLLCILIFGFSCLAFSFLPVKKIQFNNISLKAEVASEPQDRERGLMFRDSLNEDEGMLFIFKTPQVCYFWMKNMRFPIDIIWLSEDKEILGLNQNLLPCNDLCDSISSKKPVKFVLEVNAGFIQRHMVKIGDQLKF